MEILSLVLGFILLVKGSDFFVEDAARIAKKMGVSEFIIGLTLVAVGTSLPELASTVAASVTGHDNLIIGTLIGSNLANIGLILGIAAVIAGVKASEGMIKRDGYIMVGTIVIFYFFALTGRISPFAGLVFLLIYLAYVMFIIKTRDSVKMHQFGDFVGYFFKFEYLMTIKNDAIKRIMTGRDVHEYHKKIYRAFKEGLIKDIIITCLSLVAIVLGADYFVKGAIWLAGLFHLSEGLIGLSIVAIGTSLPELSVVVTAVIKRYDDLAFGDIVGSNIANILLIMGAGAVIQPISIAENLLYTLVPFTIFMSLLIIILFNRSNHTIKRWQGVILLLLYFGFVAFMFWRG